VIAIWVLLGVLVATLWLAAFGLARLCSAYDQVHCVSFAAAAAGPVLAAAGFVADGFSDRAWKILLFAALTLIAGAALTHATGRAIAFREAGGGQGGRPE
jgi:multisubunit Na+/H+ antiporter MnhG subunit